MIDRIGNHGDFWLMVLAALDSPENRQEAMKEMVKDSASESLPPGWIAYPVLTLRLRMETTVIEPATSWLQTRRFTATEIDVASYSKRH